MNRQRVLSVLIAIVIIQSCTLPRFDRRQSLYTKQFDHIRWEKILRETELKNKTLAAKTLMSHIRMFLGTRYRNGGTSITGVDCSGFVMAVYKKAININLPHNAAMMYEQTIPILAEDLKFGDLLFFENNKGKGISHVAIYLTDTKFVHASIYSGVTISDLKKDYYRHRFKGVRRVGDLNLN